MVLLVMGFLSPTLADELSSTQMALKQQMMMALI
jgi:hypothetical protein